MLIQTASLRDEVVENQPIIFHKKKPNKKVSEKMTDPPIPQTKHTLNKQAVTQSELVQQYGLTRKKNKLSIILAFVQAF
jgi:hypothetical protein